MSVFSEQRWKHGAEHRQVVGRRLGDPVCKGKEPVSGGYLNLLIDVAAFSEYSKTEARGLQLFDVPVGFLVQERRYVPRKGINEQTRFAVQDARKGCQVLASIRAELEGMVQQRQNLRGAGLRGERVLESDLEHGSQKGRRDAVAHGIRQEDA